ncbi:MAG: hypothetical protein FWE67_13030 [Planctomycetaceae bacterium]|nr:hypothetical protein [Planctomycetaceae bacterium]
MANIKDRYRREDKHKVGRTGLGAIYAALTNLAESILQILSAGKDMLLYAETVRCTPRTMLKKLGLKRL